METSAHRAYFKVKECFSHPLLKNKLIIPGTNLERITMTVSIFTIVIVILQVVAEVLRVTSIDHKVSYTLSVPLHDYLQRKYRSETASKSLPVLTEV